MEQAGADREGLGSYLNHQIMRSNKYCNGEKSKLEHLQIVECTYRETKSNWFIKINADHQKLLEMKRKVIPVNIPHDAATDTFLNRILTIETSDGVQKIFSS